MSISLCLQAMSDWAIKSGSRVLVHAGSSGVGTWVLQIAKVQLCSKFAMLLSALHLILPKAADTWRRQESHLCSNGVLMHLTAAWSSCCRNSWTKESTISQGVLAYHALTCLPHSFPIFGQTIMQSPGGLTF